MELSAHSSNILFACIFALLSAAICRAGQEGPGLAKCECDCQIVSHTGYVLCYDEKSENAVWVGYELTSDEVKGPVSRKDDFRPDPKVHTGSADLSDYRGSGFDRGHLAPAADFKWSQEAMSGTFFMSNMSPQKPGFNRGIWKQLESHVRKWAAREGIITVITGPVLTADMQTIGSNRVAVPTGYYKVVLDRSHPQIKAIGFVLPNESSEKQIREFAMSVDQVEALTGIDFFTFLPDDIESKLEKQCAPHEWF